MKGSLTTDCRNCRQPIHLLVMYSGRKAAFEPERRDPGSDTGVELERWYPIRGKGMTPGDMLDESIGLQGYYVRHRCLPALRTPEDDSIVVRGQGVRRAREIALNSQYEYTYRWPGMVHILRDDLYRAVCGDTMPGRRTAPRERSRIPDMPVCPRCLENLEGLPKRSRARILLDQTLADQASQARSIAPEVLGQFVRRRLGDDRVGGTRQPWHTAACPEVDRSINPLEWIGRDYIPDGSVVCRTCNPVTPEDRRRAHQRNIANKVSAEQILRNEEAARNERRAAARAGFSELGPYVFRVGIRGEIGAVHRFDCYRLIGRDPTDSGWQGTSAVQGRRACDVCRPDQDPLGGSEA